MPPEVVGQSLVKPDARDKVKGQALYVADMVRPGMLVGKALRSPYAHARIKSIRTDKARAISGVVAVITAADIPGENRIGGSSWKDQPVLAEDRVRFYGEAVALVAAEDARAVEQALAAIEVDYEPLPVVASPNEALTSEAPPLHPQGNLCSHRVIRRGDCDRALAQADLVISNTYTTPWVEHAYLEPNAALAEWVGDQLVVWVTTKSAHADHQEIIKVLKLPPEKVRVIAATIGGSFGGKSDHALVCMASLLTYYTGRPVKMVYTREEDIQVTTKRHPYVIHYTHGVLADGRLVAVKLDLTADAGAYTSFSPSVVTRAVVHGTGPYYVPNVHLEGRAVFTNNPVTGAMRGYGTPQIAFAYESQMDIIAEKLGMDPFTLRAINMLGPGQALATGQVLVPGIGAREALERARELVLAREAAQAADKAEKLSTSAGSEPPSPKGERWRTAWGVASFIYGNGRTGQYNPGIADIRLDQDGIFRLYVGSPDIGQGSNTILAQIAAEALGVDAALVEVTSADTGLTKDSGTTSGTRLTYIVGKGVEVAARNLKDALLKAAAQALGCSRASVEVAGDRVMVRRAQSAKLKALAGGGGETMPKSWAEEESISLRELALWAKNSGVELVASGRFDPPTTALDPETGQGNPYGAYTFGTQVAKVTVDTLTGKIDTEEIIAVYDVGTPINPQLLEAQIQGGCVGGVGYAVMEETQVHQGQVTNSNFDTYLIPTSKDIPEIEAVTVSAYDPTGPFGAKGIGEPALVPTAAAIANAVARAIGVRIRDLPLTPERVLAELEKGRAGSVQPTGGASGGEGRG